jgi:membrane-associated protease RseP (regulator of RpoE activity)
MNHLLRPYQNSHRRWSVTTLFAAGAGLALVPAIARAQALAPLLENPSPAIVQSSPAGYLGVEITDVDAAKAQALKLKEVRGALVTLIDHDAPAGQIGLKVNDVILALNGQNVEGAEQLRRILREIPPGRKVGIVISRDGNIQTLAVALSDRKTVEHDAWNRIEIDIDGIEPMPPAPSSGLLSGGGNAPASSGFHMPFFSNSLNVGALVEPLTSQMAEHLGVKGGVMVKQVARKSQADVAGFKAFDVVLKVGADSILTSADWGRALRSNQGKPVQVVVLRDKKQQTLTLQVDSKHRSAIEPQYLIPEGEGPELAGLDSLFDLGLAPSAFDSDPGAPLLPPPGLEPIDEPRLPPDELRNSMPSPAQMDELRRQMDRLREQCSGRFV